MTRPTAEQIQAAREEAGLTRTQAARLIGTTYTQWLRWEQGTRKMGGSRWFCFQQALEKRRPHLNALKAIRQWSALGLAPAPVEAPIAPVAPSVNPDQAAKIAEVLQQMADMEAKMRRRLA